LQGGAGMHVRLTQKAVAALAAKFDVASDAVHFEIIHPPRTDPQSIGLHRCGIQTSKGPARLGYQSMWLTYTDTQGARKRIPLTVTVGIEKKVWVAARDIERGDLIQAGDVELRKILLERGSLNYCDLSRDLTGLASSQRIRKDMPIRDTMVRMAPDVRAGDRVTVALSHGALLIEMTARIQREAYVGEEVSVISEATGKRIEGVLTSPERVEFGL